MLSIWFFVFVKKNYGMKYNVNNKYIFILFKKNFNFFFIDVMLYNNNNKYLFGSYVLNIGILI